MMFHRSGYIRPQLLKGPYILGFLLSLPIAAQTASPREVETGILGLDSWVAPMLDRIETVEATPAFWIKSTSSSSTGVNLYVVSTQRSGAEVKCLVQAMELSKQDGEGSTSVLVAKHGTSILLPGEMLEPGASFYLEGKGMSSRGLAIVELDGNLRDSASELRLVKRVIAMDSRGRILGCAVGGDRLLTTPACGSPFIVFKDGEMYCAGQLGYRLIDKHLEFGLHVLKRNSELFLPFSIKGKKAKPLHEDLWLVGGSLYCVPRSGSEFDLLGMVVHHGQAFYYSLSLTEAIISSSIPLNPSSQGQSTANMIPIQDLTNWRTGISGATIISHFPKFLLSGKNPSGWHSARVLGGNASTDLGTPIIVSCGGSEADGKSLGTVEALLFADHAEWGEIAVATVLLDPWKTEVRTLCLVRSEMGYVARVVQTFSPSVAYFHRSLSSLAPLPGGFLAVLSPSESVFRESSFELPPKGSMSYSIVSLEGHKGAEESSMRFPSVVSVGHVEAGDIFTLESHSVRWGL